MSGRAPRGTPWLALAAPPTAWFLYEQGLGAVVRLDCARSVPVGVVSGVLALALCIAAAWSGARSAGSAGIAGGGRASQFLGMVAAVESLVMALAILFQLLATGIVPPCAR